MIKSKLKELLSDLKKFKVQTILALNYKKRNNHKIFHSFTKLIASNSDIDKALKHASMHYDKNKKLCLWRLDYLGCSYKIQY